jgi:hypothetical protein
VKKREGGGVGRKPDRERREGGGEKGGEGGAVENRGGDRGTGWFD